MFSYDPCQCWPALRNFAQGSPVLPNLLMKRRLFSPPQLSCIANSSKDTSIFLSEAPNDTLRKFLSPADGRKLRLIWNFGRKAQAELSIWMEIKTFLMPETEECIEKADHKKFILCWLILIITIFSHDDAMIRTIRKKGFSFWRPFIPFCAFFFSFSWTFSAFNNLSFLSQVELNSNAP